MKKKVTLNEPAAIKSPVSDDGNSRLVPSKSTLAAVKRLNAGQGKIMTIGSMFQQLGDIFPEHKEFLEKKLVSYEKLREIIAKPITITVEDESIGGKIKMVQGKRYTRKFKLLKKFVLTQDEIYLYTDAVMVLAYGGILKRGKPFNDHPLGKSSFQHLKGYRAFEIRYDPACKVRKDPEKSKGIWCLYTTKGGVLRLANIGRYNTVHRQGSLDKPENEPKS